MRILDIRVKQEILTKEGLPVDEAKDGSKAALEGRVRVYLTVEVMPDLHAEGCPRNKKTAPRHKTRSSSPIYCSLPNAAVTQMVELFALALRVSQILTNVFAIIS